MKNGGGDDLPDGSPGALLRKLVSVEGGGDDNTIKGLSNRMTFSDAEIMAHVKGYELIYCKEVIPHSIEKSASPPRSRPDNENAGLRRCRVEIEPSVNIVRVLGAQKNSVTSCADYQPPVVFSACKSDELDSWAMYSTDFCPAAVVDPSVVCQASCFFFALQKR